MKKITVPFILLLLMFKANAQDSIQKFTLKQSIDYALTHKPEVQSALLEEKISKQKVNELTGLGTPQINGSAEINDLLEAGQFFPKEFFGGEKGEYAGFSLGQVYTSTIGLSASQLLFDGSYIVGLQASRTYQELSSKQTQATKIETVAAVSKAYYGALVMEARINQLQANIDRIKKSLDDTKALNQNGFVEAIDVNRIELAYNNLLVEKDKVTRFRTLNYALLKFQMGLSPNAAIELSDKLEDYPLDNVSMPDSVDYNKRADYNVMMTQHRLQELDLKRYRSTYIPSLVAYGSINTSSYRSDLNFFDSQARWLPTTVVGVKLTVPIWDGLQKNSRIQQSKLTLMKVDNALTSMKNGIQLEYINAKTAYENSRASMETTARNRDLAKEIARVSKVKYDSGVGSSLEVVDAESSLRESESNYYNTLFDAIVAKIDLDKSTGNLSY